MKSDLRMPYVTETAIIGVDFGENSGDKTAISMMCGNCKSIVQNYTSDSSEMIDISIIRHCPSCGVGFKYIDGAINHFCYRPGKIDK